MSKKMIKSLSTLVKVEKGYIADLQPRLQELSQKLSEIDLKIEDLNTLVQNERDFLTNKLTTVDFIVFLDRIEKEKINLLEKRKVIFADYEEIHTQVMEHVKSEKAYTHIKNNIEEKLREKKEKEEEDIIDDIIQMRLLSDNDN